MPLKTPLTSRRTFYARNLDGSFRTLPWNLVNTSLGAMLEPEPMAIVDPYNGGYPSIDNIDQAFTATQEIDEAAALTMFGGCHWGPTWLAELNNPTP